MAGHGGARSRSGPPPDPNALRRDRADDQATWTPLQPYTGPVPEWPLAIPAIDAELHYWNREWKRPQATKWLELGLELQVALYVKWLVRSELPNAPANLSTSILRIQDELGITISGLLKHRWVMPDVAHTEPEETPAPKASKPAGPRRGSSRDRMLRAVPPTQS